MVIFTFSFTVDILFRFSSWYVSIFGGSTGIASVLPIRRVLSHITFHYIFVRSRWSARCYIFISRRVKVGGRADIYQCSRENACNVEGQDFFDSREIWRRGNDRFAFPALLDAERFVCESFSRRCQKHTRLNNPKYASTFCGRNFLKC